MLKPVNYILYTLLCLLCICTPALGKQPLASSTPLESSIDNFDPAGMWAQQEFPDQKRTLEIIRETSKGKETLVAHILYLPVGKERTVHEICKVSIESDHVKIHRCNFVEPPPSSVTSHSLLNLLVEGNNTLSYMLRPKLKVTFIRASP